MSIFYVDKQLLEFEHNCAWDEALEYLANLYNESPSPNLLCTIIGCSWYYLIEGPVEEGSYNLDTCKNAMDIWKKHVDIGLFLYSMNPYVSFIAGYTLTLHGFFLDAEYEESYEAKGLSLMRKCLELSDGLSLRKIVEHFLKNEKSKKLLYLQNGKNLSQDLFGEDLLIEKYFREIYS